MATAHRHEQRGEGTPRDQAVSPIPPASLDPENWEEFERACRLAADLVNRHFRGIGEGPAWREIPDSVRRGFESEMPSMGRPLEAVVKETADSLFPHLLGNAHPRFFGWVLGAGTPAGAVAEFLAASMNANLGGRNHAPMLVEEQVLSWTKQLFGFPERASGLLVSGTSMATLIGLATARHHACGGRDRTEGLPGDARLVGYASADAHQSILGAFRLLGLGERALRSIPILEDGSMDITALAHRIVVDREEGYEPFAVVATAGSVTCGAIDDLEEIGKLTRREGLWMHVDGAFGAALRLSPDLAGRVKGIEAADSLAFDFHKWFHVPYDAGCILIRDPEVHLAAFGGRQDYLHSLEEGPGAGDIWPCELGPEMSRGFRAFKVWFTLQALGSEALGRAIEANCALASGLAARVRGEPDLELLGPADLNIVNFRFRPWEQPDLGEAELDRLNRQLLLRLQTEGIAIPSPIRRGGAFGLRVCICNHRTRKEDVEVLTDTVLRFGRELLPRVRISALR